MNLKENINSILRSVGLKAEEIKLEQMKLDDGVTVLEAEVFEAGQPVSIVAEDQMIPLPVGEYSLEDGRILVVAEEGLIAEIKEMETEEEAPVEEAPTDVPVAATESPATPKVVIESIVKEMKFSEVEELKALVTELKALVTELKAEIETLKTPVQVDLSADEPAAEPIKHNPEAEVELSAVNTKSLSKRGRLTEFLNKK
jgi:hypothetical protein